MQTLADSQNIELDILLDTIYKCCGYDFRQYARASINRSIINEVTRNNLKHISDLIPLILHDTQKLNELIHNLSINVTDFFREPEGYRALVNEVFPLLRSFSFVKIWHAGCSTGKEVYSLAILLKEAGLLERCLIYATDFNHSILSKAKAGVYSRDEIENLDDRYSQAGGSQSVTEYFNYRYDVAKISSHIAERITFAHHNLATDSVFGEMQLIICKNVLIYFGKKLKKKVIQLFYDSLCPAGFLLLGNTEFIETHRLNTEFSYVCTKNHLYKKCRPLPFDTAIDGKEKC